MIIIGFSGPPHAGKDTAAKAAALWFETNRPDLLWTIERVSFPLKETAVALLPNKSFCREEMKDERFFLGHCETSFRQLQIDIYRWGAEKFGPEWLGVHMRGRLSWRQQRSPDRTARTVILCPDFGRPEEVQVLIDAGHLVHQIIIVREGTTYEGDSRIPFELFNGQGFTIVNNSTPEALSELVSTCMISFLPRTP